MNSLSCPRRLVDLLIDCLLFVFFICGSALRQPRNAAREHVQERRRAQVRLQPSAADGLSSSVPTAGRHLRQRPILNAGGGVPGP